MSVSTDFWGRVKNQTTSADEKSMGLEVRYTETQIDGRMRCHGSLIQPRLQSSRKIKSVTWPRGETYAVYDSHCMVGAVKHRRLRKAIHFEMGVRTGSVVFVDDVVRD